MNPTTTALLAALAVAPAVARPDSTAGCHCFQDRSFEPDRPGAADAYILATTRSSLLSAAFGVPKKDLVMAVMTGTQPEDLWIAYWAAARGKRSAASLLQARKGAGSWKAVLGTAGPLEPAFDAALARGAPDADLCALAVDDVLVHRARALPAALRSLRSAGANTEETVVATVLSAKLAAPVLPLVAQVKAGRATWGSVLNDAGIEPRELDGLVRAMVR
ncbi:MAG TPA: hypothetical protein VLT61_09035 [Anaeromyxobacteraceae bacterium]|nr:hypothetical protein [Anaeromyxobacteraceae bacterium]